MKKEPLVLLDLPVSIAQTALEAIRSRQTYLSKCIAGNRRSGKPFESFSIELRDLDRAVACITCGIDDALQEAQERTTKPKASRSPKPKAKAEPEAEAELQER